MFDQSPGADMKSVMRFGPIVENHLTKHFAAFFVNEMVQLDQVDPLPCGGRRRWGRRRNSG